MTQLDSIYSIVLYTLKISDTQINECREMIKSCPELLKALDNPCISLAQKENVIDSLFCKELTSFLKVLCVNGVISRILYIFDEYRSLVLENRKIMQATLSYVTKPQESQLEALKKMLCTTYDKADANIVLKHDPSIMGGFILQAGDYRYDRSFAKQLENIKQELIRG